MEAALGWIGDFAQWVVNWLPHVGICRKTHGGVKFVRGRHVKEIHPGLYLWWPITTEVELTETAQQTLNLTAQKLTTKDGRTILIDVVVIYRVEDVQKALVDTADYESTACDVALEATTEIVIDRTFKELHDNLCDKVGTAITLRCRTYLKEFGLAVKKCRVSDFAETNVYCVDGLDISSV